VQVEPGDDREAEAGVAVVALVCPKGVIAIVQTEKLGEECATGIQQDHAAGQSGQELCGRAAK